MSQLRLMTLLELVDERVRIDQEIARRHAAADDVHPSAVRLRDSLPPVLAVNAPTRAKSDEHFRNARKILAGLK